MTENTETKATARPATPSNQPGRAPDPADPRVRFNKGKTMVWLTIRSILFDRKTMAVAAILLLLLAIPLLWLRDPPADDDDAGMELFVNVVVIVYLQFIVLYTCFLYGTALITSEVDDRTMTYLISRPISRFEIVVYKYIGYVVSIFALFAVPVILNYLILAPFEGLGAVGSNLGILFYSLGSVLMGVMVWGALFLLMASVFKNPLMPGFFYCLLWESFLDNMGGNLPKATVTYYVRTFLFNGLKSVRESITEGGDLPQHGDMSTGSVFMLGVLASVAFVLFTWWMVQGKDFH